MSKELLAQKNEKEETNKVNTKPTFKIVTQGFDWGPGHSKIIIDLNEEIEDILMNVFKIEAKKSYTSYDPVTKEGKEETGTREIDITSCYLSDSSGNETESRARYVTLELDVHPDNVFTNPFNYSFKTGVNSYTLIDYTITQLNPIYTVSKRVIRDCILTQKELKEIIEPEADLFETGVFNFSDDTNDGIKLSYASYTPEKTDTERPLIVILHGAGEGGTDPRVPLYGNKSVALASEAIQNYFGGAYILSPQTPTMWMDDGTGEYTRTGKSMYTDALLALIEEYTHNNSIDLNRIYIGGGSNGGYMTVNLLLAKPDLFAAAFPICQAYSSDWVSDDQLGAIKDIPMWFIHSTNDPVVSFHKTAHKLVERLNERGAKDIRLTTYDQVIDTSGLYKTAGNDPYKYNDHWSWIYVYNDEVKDNGLSLFEWLASK